MEVTNLQMVEEAISATDTSEMDGKYLTFWTDEQLFGVPIANVVQIVGIPTITEVPEFPHYAKGIINMRGTIIPVIDVRLRLGKQETQYNERTCTIVTNIDENLVGVIVDEVDAVTVIAEELISPPPQMAGGADSFLIGIGKLEDKVVLLMDTRKVVGAEKLNLLPDII